MHNRKSPRANHGPYMRHGGHGQGHDSFNQSPNESPISFHFGGNSPIPPEQIVYTPHQPGPINQSELLPAAPPSSSGELVEKKSDSDNKSSGFSLPNLSEIKGMVDRLGGIDGILTGVTKVQKVVASVSQMAPLIKVLFSSFSKKSKDDKESDADEWKPRPRRKRRKKSGGGSVKRRRPVSGSTKRRRR